MKSLSVFLIFSYSNGYAYDLGSSKQFFLARVIVGDSKFIMPNDKSLKKPPTRGKNIEGTTEDYDSVSGETRNSKVIMVYENGHAYPEYLISYA